MRARSHSRWHLVLCLLVAFLCGQGTVPAWGAFGSVAEAQDARPKKKTRKKKNKNKKQRNRRGQRRGGARSQPKAKPSPQPRQERGPEAADEAGEAAREAAADADSEIVREGDTEVKVMTFSGLDVEGQLDSPMLLYFVNRVRAEFDRPSLPHRSFMPELQRSTRGDELK